MRLFKYGAAVVLAGGVMAGSPAIAQSPETLQKIEDSLSRTKAKEKSLEKTARETAAEIALLRRQSIAIASRAASQQETLLKLNTQREILDTQMATAKQRLSKNRSQMTAVLTALQRIAANPPVALIALPQDPLDSVRSALLLRDSVPALEGRARLLRDDLEALAEIAVGLKAARRKIESRKTRLDAERKSLMAVLDRKAALAEKTLAEKKATSARSRQLAQKARSLRALIDRLSRERIARKAEETRRQAVLRERPKPPPTPSVSARRPATGLPVAGRIIAPFGRSAGPGQPAEGVSLKTASGSFVVAPRSGRIVFSGPFRGLGQLLIIEYGDEYHLLLAGMARIDARTGNNVLAGEPVGIMNTSENSNPVLYVELRRNGKPVNPMPWLASRRK